MLLHLQWQRHGPPRLWQVPQLNTMHCESHSRSSRYQWVEYTSGSMDDPYFKFALIRRSNHLHKWRSSLCSYCMDSPIVIFSHCTTGIDCHWSCRLISEYTNDSALYNIHVILIYVTRIYCHALMYQCHYGIATDVHTPPISSGASTCSCYYVTRGYTTQSYHLYII